MTATIPISEPLHSPIFNTPTKLPCFLKYAKNLRVLCLIFTSNVLQSKGIRPDILPDVPDKALTDARFMLGNVIWLNWAAPKWLEI
ncbi:hypothetical protein Moror_11714, partial [Moniliophthora roreri MCA 2997]